jgi:hypothetical protein
MITTVKIKLNGVKGDLLHQQKSQENRRSSLLVKAVHSLEDVRDNSAIIAFVDSHVYLANSA